MKVRTNDEILKGLGKKEDYGRIVDESDELCDICGAIGLTIFSKGGIRCNSCGYNRSKGYYVPRQWFTYDGEKKELYTNHL